MTTSPDVLIFSFSFSLSVKAGKLTTTVRKSDITSCMSARQQQSRRVRRRPAHTINVRKDLGIKSTQPVTPLFTSSAQADARFTSLSDRAQHMQRQVREQFTSPSQRRRGIDLDSLRGPATDQASQAALHTEISLCMDRESLRLLEAASNFQAAPAGETGVTTSGRMHREPSMETSRRMDHDSLRLLQKAYDDKLKEPRGEDLLQSSSGWSIINLTFSAALNKVCDLFGTPSSKGLPGSKTDTPRSPTTKSLELYRGPHDVIVLQRDTSTALSTPQLSETKPAQPPRLSRSSFDISPLQLDESATAHRPHSLIVKCVESVVTPRDVSQDQLGLDGKSKQTQEQSKTQCDYMADPFGPLLVYGGQGEEVQPRRSLVEYRKRQADSVHELFRQLEQKDREESCRETSGNLKDSAGSIAKDVKGSMVKQNCEEQPQAQQHKSSLAFENCEAPLGEEMDDREVGVSSGAIVKRESDWLVV